MSVKSKKEKSVFFSQSFVAFSLEKGLLPTRPLFTQWGPSIFMDMIQKIDKNLAVDNATKVIN